MTRAKSSEAKTKIAEKEGTVVVTATVLNQKKDERKKIKIRPFVTDTANVSVKFGATVKMGGEYDFARVDVMISMPCYAEEVADMYKKVRGAVDRLVSHELDRMTGEVKDGG